MTADRDSLGGVRSCVQDTKTPPAGNKEEPAGGGSVGVGDLVGQGVDWAGCRVGGSGASLHDQTAMAGLDTGLLALWALIVVTLSLVAVAGTATFASNLIAPFAGTLTTF